MSKEAMNLALEALEKGKYYAKTLMMSQEPFDAAIKALAEQPAQQEPEKNKRETFEVPEFNLELDAGFAAQEYCRSLWGAARGHSDWRKIHDAFVAGYKSAPQPAQQEPDLSGLKPATREAIKGWIADGTFINRAISAMKEQESENMRLEKMVAEKPAQQEPVAKVDASDEGYWADILPDHTVKVGQLLYAEAPQPAQRKPLKDEEIYKITNDLFYGNGPCDTLAMCRAIEAAHGIKEKP